MLIVLAGAGIDYAVSRMPPVLRDRQWPYRRLIALGAVLISLIGIPAGAFVALDGRKSENLALFSALILFVAWVVIIGRGGPDKLDRLERQRKISAERRPWYDLDRRQRSEIKRLAKQGRQHPDPVVAAIASQWAEDTIARRAGGVRLAKQITAAASPTPTQRPT